MGLSSWRRQKYINVGHAVNLIPLALQLLFMRANIIRTTALEKLLSVETQGTVAYYYCSFSDNASLDTANIFGSILSQLCPPDSKGFDSIQSAYDTACGTSTSPPKLKARQLLELLLEVVQIKPKTYLFIDAVNECNEPEEILDLLGKLSETGPETQVHIFLSSINEKGIEEQLDQWKPPFFIAVTLRARDIQDDIDLLIQASIASSSRLSKQPEIVKKEITDVLKGGAQGMLVFLLSVLKPQSWELCELTRRLTGSAGSNASSTGFRNLEPQAPFVRLSQPSQ
jgi:hypothetical protein